MNTLLKHSLSECVTYQIYMIFILKPFRILSDLKHIIIIRRIKYHNVLNNRKINCRGSVKNVEVNNKIVMIRAGCLKF